MAQKVQILMSFVTVVFFLSVPAGTVRSEPSGMTWKETIEVASGGGYQGPWRMNESVYDYVDDPTVDINEQGFVGVVFGDQSRKNIFFQLYTPDGKAMLEKPVNVSQSPRVLSWLPRIVITSTDTIKVFVLWQEIVFSGGTHGGETFFSRSTDGGKTFSDPLNLSNDITGSGKGRLTQRLWHNGSLDIAMGPQGNLYATWTEYEGTLWFSRSTDGGATFSPSMRVAGGYIAAPARGPTLAVDSDGAVYLAWTVGEDAAADIHLAISTDHGLSFNAPKKVFESGGHSDAPKIVVDNKGTVHLVYSESPTGPFQQYRIMYTRQLAGKDTFKIPREISSPQSGQGGGANFPALSLGGEDKLYVLWELYPDRGFRGTELGFTHSNDGGQTFESPSVVPGTGDPKLGINGSLQGSLMRKLAVNSAGVLAIVNSTFKRNQESHVWLFRGQVTD